MKGGWAGALIFYAGAVIVGVLTFWSLPTASPTQSLAGGLGTLVFFACGHVCRKHGSSNL